MDQVAAAREWAGKDICLELKGLPFPYVDPNASTDQVMRLAESTLERLESAGALPGEPVMVMGEFTLVSALVTLLKARGYVPLVATTHREALENLQADGSVSTTHRFRFVNFRPY